MNQTLIGEDLRLEIPRLTRPVGPTPSSAFADLFHAVDALREPGQSLVLLFAGAGPAATAAIASGFARTAERAMDLPILFVDASGERREDASPDLLARVRAGFAPREIALPTRDPQISWIRLGGAGLGAAPVLPGTETARLIEACSESFPLVVIDGGAMTAGSTVNALARHCDGIVLVARAGRTEAASLAIARVGVERAGGRVLGAVIDEDDATMPRFLAAMI